MFNNCAIKSIDCKVDTSSSGMDVNLMLYEKELHYALYNEA